MLKSISIFQLFALLILFVSCSDDEIEDASDNQNTLGINEVVFDDDNIVCTPISSNVSISTLGILSVIMKPCQNSSSKLDGYFKFGGKPAAGTYTVIGTAGTFPNIANVPEGQFTMVFYGHASEALFSTSGTIELTVNSDDATKLDMKWTDVVMEGVETTTKFSGNLVRL